MAVPCPIGYVTYPSHCSNELQRDACECLTTEDLGLAEAKAGFLELVAVVPVLISVRVEKGIGVVVKIQWCRCSRIDVIVVAGIVSIFIAGHPSAKCHQEGCCWQQNPMIVIHDFDFRFQFDFFMALEVKSLIVTES